MTRSSTKIAVTGADGFIGSHLVQQLVRQGYQVRALCQYNSFNNFGWLSDLEDDELKSIELVLGDVRDPAQMQHFVKGCETVFHLAALIAIPYSYVAPSSYVQTNVMGTLNVLQAAREAGVTKFIHTSTSEVYGTAKYVPIDETHPLEGQSPYSASKIGADKIAQSYHLSFDLPVVTVRPFNTYGPRQSNRAVIPAILSQLLNGERTLKLGSVLPTRDFNFVADTVSGFIAAMSANQVGGEVFNIGSNFEISIKDTAQVIADTIGVSVKIVTEDSRLRPENSEVFRLWASNQKALEGLGWRPQYAGLEGFRRGGC